VTGISIIVIFLVMATLIISGFILFQQIPDTNHSNQMREESRMTFQIPVDHILFRSGDLTISPLSLFPVRSGLC